MPRSNGAEGRPRLGRNRFVPPGGGWEHWPGPVWNASRETGLARVVEWTQFF
jgi:hypothetical protein